VTPTSMRRERTTWPVSGRAMLLVGTITAVLKSRA
jgi:hypothetical protein